LSTNDDVLRKANNHSTALILLLVRILMPWTGLLNHDKQIERFRRAVVSNRLASTYLFVGKPGIGKRLFAIKLAEALLCEHPVGTLDACGQCSACTQVHSATHPDLILIAKPEDKAFIPVELFIGDKEHRRQNGLIHDIGLRPFRGGRKIAIIKDADFLNQEGANSLLKTLEEPPPQSILILIGTSEQKQLRTIISRSQIVRFEPLSALQIEQLLQQSEIQTSVPLELLAKAAEGSMATASRLADVELFEFRDQLYQQLSSGDPGKDDFAKTMISLVKAAGSEAAAKRDRLNFLADLAISFFRSSYCELANLNLEPVIDELAMQSISNFASRLKQRSVSSAMAVCSDSIERSLELQYHVHANVGAANAIEDWMIQLGRIFRGK
jgi:DNA polymerase-3 subunit delta'